MKKSFRVFLGLLLAVALTAGTALAQGVQYGAATPQELIQRLEKAAKADDLAEMVRCMEPDGRKAMAAMLTIMPVMMVAFGGMAGEMAEGMADAVGAEGEGAAAAAEKEMEGFKNDFVALLARHGIGDPFREDEDGFDPETDFAKVDVGAYVVDVMAFMEERFPGESSTRKAMPFEGEDLAITELTVTGDRAVAKAGDESVEMVRIDGRWFLHMPEEEPAGF